MAVPTEGTGLHLQVGDRVDVLGPSDARATAAGRPARSTTSPPAPSSLAVDDAAVALAVGSDDVAAVARALAAGTPVLALTGATPDP